MGISFETKGNLDKFDAYLAKLNMVKDVEYQVLKECGELGVQRLAENTPQDTGLLAASWGYDIESEGDTMTLNFINTDIENGVNVAILVQYGHATSSGIKVEGIDYINPALKPIFDNIADIIVKELESL